MGGLVGLIVMAHCRMEGLHAAPLLVAADIVIADEVCGYVDIQDGLVGSGHGDDAIARDSPSACRCDRYAALELHFPLEQLMGWCHSLKRHLAAAALDDDIMMWRGELGVERYGAFPRRCEAYAEDTVCERRVRLATVSDTIDSVCRDSHGRIERQPTLIAGVCLMAWGGYGEVAECLVWHAAV